MKVIAHKCTHCHRMFATERGQKTHERKCKFNGSCRTCKFMQVVNVADEYYEHVRYVCDHEKEIPIMDWGCQYKCKLYEIKESSKKWLESQLAPIPIIES